MVRSLRDRLNATYNRFWSSETAPMLTMALLVGLGSGYGAVGFRWLIDAAHRFFFTASESLTVLLGAPATAARIILILTPGVGGLVAGLLVHFVASEVKGPGVSNVMEALALRGGRMRPIIILAKPAATAVTLGSGGSGGREGPVVQIGSAIGSMISQLAQLSDERAKNLVACGAAGGIAATFNAPLAGVMFALEVLLAEFGLVRFTSVVVASVTASVVGHTYFGDVPAFPFPPSAAPRPWELVIYALLGAVAAFVGVGFTRLLHTVEALFEKPPLPPHLKPALGGLAVGIAGFWFPRVLGVGYDSIEAVLFNRLAITSIFVLGVLKVIVTSLTIGSGASAGIFGPSLFIGSMLGGVFGQLVHGPSSGTLVPSSYPVVGMSAVFAAVSHAPITAILTLFEMTRDYTLILPLMLASVVSATLARHLLDENIYTLTLGRAGIDIYAGRRLDLMGTISVSDAMTPIEGVTTVTPSMPLSELVQVFDETHHHGLMVLDGRRRLIGVVTLSDLERAQTDQLMTGTVRDIQTTNVRTVFPDQTLKSALQYFGVLDVGRIPVVDRVPPHPVVGLLRRGDILRAYSSAAMEQQARLGRLDRATLQTRTNAGSRESQRSTPVVEIRLRPKHAAVGKTIQELDLPSHSLIASVRRGSQIIIPRGDTQLRAGDVLVALATEDEKEDLRGRLTNGT